MTLFKASTHNITNHVQEFFSRQTITLKQRSNIQGSSNSVIILFEPGLSARAHKTDMIEYTSTDSITLPIFPSHRKTKHSPHIFGKRLWSLPIQVMGLTRWGATHQIKATAKCLLAVCLLCGFLDAAVETLKQQQVCKHLASGSDLRQQRPSRSLKYFASSTTKGTEATATKGSTRARSAHRSSQHREPRTPSWSLIFPAVSVSFLSWFLRKHALQCCGDETVVHDDSVPAEIVVKYTGEHVEDIELQSISPSKSDQLGNDDPVQGLPMLNTSSYTIEESSRDVTLIDATHEHTSTDYTLL